MSFLSWLRTYLVPKSSSKLPTDNKSDTVSTISIKDFFYRYMTLIAELTGGIILLSKELVDKIKSMEEMKKRNNYNPLILKFQQQGVCTHALHLSLREAVKSALTGELIHLKSQISGSVPQLL